MGRAWILGVSSPSMMRPESFQCSTSLIPGSCGCRLVMFCAVLASQMLTMCLSALMIFRLDPPAHHLCSAQMHQRWSSFAGIGCRTGAGHAAAMPQALHCVATAEAGHCKSFEMTSISCLFVQAVRHHHALL